MIFSNTERDKAGYTLLHLFYTQGNWRCEHTVTVPGSDRSPGQVEPRFSWPPTHCSFNTIKLPYSPKYNEIRAAEGTGEATLSQFDGPLETEIEPREPPSLNSAVPTPTSFGLFSQFQLRRFYLFFLFLETHLEMKPFITAHPQTVCGSIIDNESAAKKWKCCFNNLGLKYILLYASKGFNKKSTCRDIFSWLKQQSKAYKCSPTIMTYL